jgi:hypothetical protein
MTTEEVKLIKSIIPYKSVCNGVWLNKKGLWGARFWIKEHSQELGNFLTEVEAIKAYMDYHEQFYQNILNKLKTQKG